MIGDRLRELREKNGLSQIDLAKERKVKSATVSRHELGTNDPDTATIKWYAERFAVSADWILGLTDDPTPAGAATQKIAQKAIEGEPEKSREELAAQLPIEIREAVLALIRIETAKK